LLTQASQDRHAAAILRATTLSRSSTTDLAALLFALAALIFAEVLLRAAHLRGLCRPRPVPANFDGRALERCGAKLEGLRTDPQPSGAGARHELGVVHGAVAPRRPEHAGEATSQRNDSDAFAASFRDGKRPAQRTRRPVFRLGPALLTAPDAPHAASEGRRPGAAGATPSRRRVALWSVARAHPRGPSPSRWSSGSDAEPARDRRESPWRARTGLRRRTGVERSGPSRVAVRGFVKRPLPCGTAGQPRLAPAGPMTGASHRYILPSSDVLAAGRSTQVR
jgi:hypothetical protein